MTRRVKQGWILRGTLTLCLILLHLAVSTRGAAETDKMRNDDIKTIERLTSEMPGASAQETITLLLQRGEAYRASGLYDKSALDFIAALEKAKALQLKLLEVTATQCLGYVTFLLQQPAKAETLLVSALETAQTLNRPGLAAVCANRLGTVLADQEKTEAARTNYRKALDFARKVMNPDPGLNAAILRNLAHLTTESNEAFTYLSDAYRYALAMSSSVETVDLFIGIAAEAAVKDPENEHLKFRYTILNKAFVDAVELDSPRLISLAAGKLGNLYEQNGRNHDALSLTEHAVEAAQSINSMDLLLQWEWQRGRVLRALGLKDKAIDAFWRAAFYIEELRLNIPVIYHGDCSLLRKTVSPVYLSLADLLLQASGEAHDPEKKQHLLKQVQKAVESIKQSEVRDYFRDPCIDSLVKNIESLSPDTAVIYPIILPDRLELLADIDGVLHRKTTPVGQKELEKTITTLVSNLRNFLFHKQLSHTVYSWLVAPLESLLSKHRIETLLFIPDGVFRMLPLTSLWNGEAYLAEIYSVATEPGLSLLDPKELPRKDMKTLLAGMSRPGPVVMDLPAKLWSMLCRTPQTKTNRGIRGLSVKVEQLGPPELSPLSEASHGRAAVEHVKELLELPGVDHEMETLSLKLPNAMLLNETFLLESFSKELQEQNYRIIHIASHGFFGGIPEQNFIMTYDKCMDMDRLEGFIKPKQLDENPVEMIALSACQTAEGDDRSPLGLAGVALKSGARSVIGSLWPVSDTATQELFAEFYSNLKNPGISKAEALRRAQVHLIKTEGFDHPFFWSAFILTGNWL